MPIRSCSTSIGPIPTAKSDHHENVSRRARRAGNPPGFDAHLIGLQPGREKTFAIHFPEDYGVKEMANTDVTYTVKVKEIRRKVLPELDDEFAKDLGEFESLAALRDRVRADMQAEAERGQRSSSVRSDLLKQLAQRIGFELPAVDGRPRNRPPARGVRASA